MISGIFSTEGKRNRGHLIQDTGNPSQPGDPSKEWLADFVVKSLFFRFFLRCECGGGRAAGAAEDDRICFSYTLRFLCFLFFFSALLLFFSFFFFFSRPLLGTRFPFKLLIQVSLF